MSDRRTPGSSSNRSLREALVEAAEDEERLRAIVGSEAVTDIDLRAALRGRLPAAVSAFVVERSRFAGRPAVLGAVAMSPSTPVRITLEILGGLAWRDLAEAATRAELAPAVRQRAESTLLDGLRALRLGDLITLSRIGPRRVARTLLMHADERVRAGALRNPRLRSVDLCDVAEHASAPSALAAEILETHRWAGLYDVRRAIARGTATPRPLALSLIATLNPGDLREMAESDAVPPLISAVARRLLG